MIITTRLAKESDYEVISDIHKTVSKFYFEPSGLKKSLAPSNRVCTVAIHREVVVGFIYYEITSKYLKVYEFVIAETHRRQGVGTKLLDSVLIRMRENYPKKVMGFVVRERNLDLQLFLKKHGFRAKAVKREFFPDTGEDSYSMVLA